ncbi:MAG: transcriptional regulator [Nitrososphaeraceae archaeon]|jgi:TRAP-type C4-dicarboxylate transport system permease large subunit
MKPSPTRTKVTGISILGTAIIGFIIYLYLILATQWDILLLKITIIAAVGAVVSVVAWIGYTMTTTPIADNE